MSTPENLKCPDCGGEMMPRTNRAKGTKFWGCKRFPACRGTRDTDGLSFAERQQATRYANQVELPGGDDDQADGRDDGRRDDGRRRW